MAADSPSNSDEPVASAGLALGYWTSVAAIVLLVWLAPAIPTQDGPSHLYNLALIDELLSDSPPRSNVHELQFSTLTNVGFIAVALPLGTVLPLWAVERAILSLHIVLIALFATSWLAQTGRPRFPIAWVGLAFCLPWSLFMGFYGYQLGADFALLALCAGWKRRDSNAIDLTVRSLVSGVLILAFHAAAAALFAGLLALMQLTNPRVAFVERSARAGMTSLPLLVIAFASVSGGGNGSPPEWQGIDYVVLTLATIGTLSFSSQLITCLLVAFGWIVLCLPGESPRLRDHAARFAFAGGLALITLHILLPDRIGGGGYLTGRFAWWIPLITLPLLETGAMATGRIKRELLPFAIAFVSIGSTLISAAPDARLVAEVEEAARNHPVKGVIASAIFDRTPKSDAMIEPLRHVSSLFVREEGILMTNYQARVSFFPLRFTDGAKSRFPHIDINAAWETNWRRLPISELVSIDANQDDRIALSHGFESVWKSEQNRVELWRKR
jgi:hypothetical protein